jgi:hypothetical protein
METNNITSTIDRYIAPDGTMHEAPQGRKLTEATDGSNRLLLDGAAVNVENDGKLTPVSDQSQWKNNVPNINDDVAMQQATTQHKRVNLFVVEPNRKNPMQPTKGNVLIYNAANNTLFMNDTELDATNNTPILEKENKLFLNKQEIEIKNNEIIPVIEKQAVSIASDTKEAFDLKNPIAGKKAGITIEKEQDMLSAFLINFMHNYKHAQEAGKSPKFEMLNPKEQIDWQELADMGVEKNYLLKSGHLEKMLNGQKTDLIPITITDKQSEIIVNTQARLSLKQNPLTKKFSIKTNLLQENQTLEQYAGHRLSDIDRENLLKTGNLGRVLTVKFKGENVLKNIFLSLDKQTKELIAFDAGKVKIPTVIAGRQITPEEQQAFGEGKAVKLDGLTNVNGVKYTKTLQFSTIEKRFREVGPNISRIIKGAHLTEEQQAKLNAGETIQIVNMIDNKGEKFSAYVRYNHDKEKLDFSKSRDFTKKYTPTNEHKTQVEGNNNGHKPNSLKDIKEPLKSKQPNNLTEEQLKKRIEALQKENTKLKTQQSAKPKPKKKIGIK